MHSALCSLIQKTHKHSGRPQLAEQRHFFFPVTIKASRLIEAFRCGCSLIVLLCVVAKLQYRLKKVNVTAIPLQTWTVSSSEAPRFKDNRYMIVLNMSVPLTGRLYPREYYRYSFLLEAQLNSGPQCGLKDYSTKIFQ